MGMDGISIANTGAVKDPTSAEMAAKTEQAIQTDTTNETRQVQSLSVNRRVRSKDDEDEGSGREKSENQGSEPQEEQETFQDGLIEENSDESSEEYNVEDIENPNKEFYVKLNVKDDIIELYDSSTERLVETISGNELGELVQKLNMASGIFVNKKV